MTFGRWISATVWDLPKSKYQSGLELRLARSEALNEVVDAHLTDHSCFWQQSMESRATRSRLLGSASETPDCAGLLCETECLL